MVSPHRIASEVGAGVLREGGNAVDAVVAANAVLCVVYPHMTSVGGDLFALIWPAGSEAPIGYRGAGRSGAAATIEAVRAQGHAVMPRTGALTVTVPGTPEAWGKLIERFGTWGLAAVLDPAAGIADAGFEVTANLSGALSAQRELLDREPVTSAQLPAVAAGGRLRNSDLAATLRSLGRYGYNDFYRGELAEAIAATLAERSGFVTAGDLALHHGEWTEPVSARLDGVTVYECPPPTQGLAALGMMVRTWAGGSHRLASGAAFAETLRAVRDRVYPLRDRYVTDPGLVSVPVEPFLRIDELEAGPGIPIPEGDTVYLCAADEHGNLVSLIQSVAGPFGSGVTVPGAGFLLHNRGCYFDLDPARVNHLAPRKLTMHTLIPAMADLGGGRRLAFGSMGGDGQPQFQLQVLANLIGGGLDPEATVTAPRIRIMPGGAPWVVEADYPEAALLAARGWQSVSPRQPLMMGHAHALIAGPGGWTAGADPRSDGSVEVSI